MIDMIHQILDLVKSNYALTKKDIGEFEAFKVKGMKFTCQAYDVSGLGHISVMQAKGFFGLMKMDTIVIAPIDKDLPLFSYDRIYAMGNDTLFIEFYDTMSENKLDISPLTAISKKYAYLPDRFEKGKEPKHWYDDIRLPETVNKKGKKKNSKDFDAYTLESFFAYLELDAEICDKEEKLARTRVYANGLITNGGPAVNVFKKEMGEEKAAKVIHTVLFGTN
jgi:hypothetical protein